MGQQKHPTISRIHVFSYFNWIFLKHVETNTSDNEWGGGVESVCSKNAGYQTSVIFGLSKLDKFEA